MSELYNDIRNDTPIDYIPLEVYLRHLKRNTSVDNTNLYIIVEQMVNKLPYITPIPDNDTLKYIYQTVKKLSNYKGRDVLCIYSKKFKLSNKDIDYIKSSS